MDGDGDLDVVTGSYSPGHLYVFLRNGSDFKQQTLTTPDGKPIEVESAAAPGLVDWDNDGDLDLVVGFIMGPAKYFLNEGNFKFQPGKDVMVGGNVLEGNDLGPTFADWNGDGTPDLICGDGGTNTTFYPGKRTDMGLELGSGTVLVQTPGWESVYGVRSKPHVTDWNMDGKLDLLIGDFGNLKGPAPKLTAAQKKRKAALEKQLNQTSTAFNKVAQSMQAAAMKKAGITDLRRPMTKEETERFSKAYEAEMKRGDYMKLNQRFQELDRQMAPLRPKSEMTGHVWVYLRKKPSSHSQ
jgi:hypothetical protein